MSTQQSSHAYGIGVIALIIGMGAVFVFYTSFYLPEQMQKPSVSHKILEADIFDIAIVPGALVDNGIDYYPKNAEVILGVNNHVKWTNDDDAHHTVTPLHKYDDSYSGEFQSLGVLKPGESYEFIFTEVAIIEYQCLPHPWMRGTLSIEENRFG